ncbi:MAG: hypothetical protein JWN56_2405 [Sphingobacteriales bacterium]|nr:hypothetical protein [Sphingobacteriales bacterium]
MKTGKFLISNRRNGEFQFSLKDQNDQEILASEGYNSKTSCVAIIHLIKNRAANDCVFDCHITDKGEFYFELLTANGYIICRSSNYNTREQRDAAIEKIRLLASDAIIDDRVKVSEYY